jgi:AcrR family transcriptional regulator
MLPPPTISPNREGTRAGATAARREAILAAALSCFSRYGYAQTSIEQVCRISGASNGSLYHHFSDKPGLGAALYIEGIERYQQAMLSRLEHSQSPKAVVRGMVEEHFGWVRENGDMARFLFLRPEPEVLLAAQSELRKLNRRFTRQVEQRWSEARRSGKVRDARFEVVMAIAVGSYRELTKRWLEEGRAPDDAAAAELGDLVWRAVKPGR